MLRRFVASCNQVMYRIGSDVVNDAGEDGVPPNHDRGVVDRL